ncbi:MAG TPA: ribosome biogenesis GTP-binding protein YihA/YsxC [Bacteroidia bacterium]|nr:ribosome biogenesis GTP-binding protein YihA/YsxC [Bacteroidia bacterium]
MEIESVRFTGSYTLMDKLPKDGKPEVAFIGRSNVGKSSLINMLTGRKIAKTSSTPGKTQTINHFLIDDAWYLVDLPGYGYAKVSKDQRAKWETMINTYLLKREELYCVFVLIDSRVPPQKSDLDFITMLGENGLPVGLIFTKTDKLKSTELQNNTKTFFDEMIKNWEELPPYFITSAEKKTGKEDVLAYLYEITAGK